MDEEESTLDREQTVAQMTRLVAVGTTIQAAIVSGELDVGYPVEEAGIGISRPALEEPPEDELMTSEQGTVLPPRSPAVDAFMQEMMQAGFVDLAAPEVPLFAGENITYNNVTISGYVDTNRDDVADITGVEVPTSADAPATPGRNRTGTGPVILPPGSNTGGSGGGVDEPGADDDESNADATDKGTGLDGEGDTDTGLSMALIIGMAAGVVVAICLAVFGLYAWRWRDNAVKPMPVPNPKPKPVTASGSASASASKYLMTGTSSGAAGQGTQTSKSAMIAASKESATGPTTGPPMMQQKQQLGFRFAAANPSWGDRANAVAGSRGTSDAAHPAEPAVIGNLGDFQEHRGDGDGDTEDSNDTGVNNDTGVGTDLSGYNNAALRRHSGRVAPRPVRVKKEGGGLVPGKPAWRH